MVLTITRTTQALIKENARHVFISCEKDKINSKSYRNQFELNWGVHCVGVLLMTIIAMVQSHPRIFSYFNTTEIIIPDGQKSYGFQTKFSN